MENGIKILNVLDYPGGLKKASEYIHSIWGNEKNLPFYEDAIKHSARNSIPCFFLMLDGQEILGCYGFIINDFISRHDLYPWFACLYIEKKQRGKNLSARFFDHARAWCKKNGFTKFYLTTDHDGFYEKHGFERMDDAYDLSGERTRVYFYVVE